MGKKSIVLALGSIALFIIGFQAAANRHLGIGIICIIVGSILTFLALMNYFNTQKKFGDTKETNNLIRKKELIALKDYCKCYSMPKDFTVIDVETTGLELGQIIQIGAIKCRDGQIIDRFNTYVNPETSIPDNITKLTGITDKMVEDAPKIDLALVQFNSFIAKDVLVAHNAKFDMKFIQSYENFCFESTLDNEIIDTLELAQKYIKDTPNHKLVTLKDYLEMDIKSHDALNDCEVTVKLYLHCIEKSLENEINEENPKPTFDLSDEELQYYEKIKSIISLHDRNAEKLSYVKYKTYFDIRYGTYSSFYGHLRFKLNGNKRYWLHHKEVLEYLNNIPNIKYEPGSSSEGINSIRIFLEGAEQLSIFEKVILDFYDRCEQIEKEDEKYANLENNLSI